MISLCQDSDARGVVVHARCCLVNSCPRFRRSDLAQNVVTICLCDKAHVVSLSYKPSISSLTRCGSDPTFPADTRFAPNILGRACCFRLWKAPVWTASALSGLPIRCSAPNTEGDLRSCRA